MASQALAKDSDAAEGYFAGDGSDIPTFVREAKFQVCKKLSGREDLEAPGRSSYPHVCGLPFHIRTRVIYAADCCLALNVFRVDEDDKEEKCGGEGTSHPGVDDFISGLEKVLNFRSQVT